MALFLASKEKRIRRCGWTNFPLKDSQYNFHFTNMSWMKDQLLRRGGDGMRGKLKIMHFVLQDSVTKENILDQLMLPPKAYEFSIIYDRKFNSRGFIHWSPWFFSTQTGFSFVICVGGWSEKLQNFILYFVKNKFNIILLKFFSYKHSSIFRREIFNGIKTNFNLA